MQNQNQNFDYRAGGRFSAISIAVLILFSMPLNAIADDGCRDAGNGVYECVDKQQRPPKKSAKSLPPEYPEPPSRGSRSTLPLAMQQGGFPIELPQPPLPTVEPNTGSVNNGVPKGYRGSGRFES